MTEEQENKGPAAPRPGSSAAGAQAAQAASAPGAGARAPHPAASAASGARVGLGSSGAEREKGGPGFRAGFGAGVRAEGADGKPGTQGKQVGGAKSGTESRANSLPGDWRGPVFWMSCGALLAALAGGGVMLAQRVSDERDLLAVAATLPPARPAPEARGAAEQPAPDTAAAGRSVQEARARAARQPDSASILSGATQVPGAQQGAGAAASTEAKVKVRQSSTRAKGAASKRKAKPAARRQVSAGERYADVFKRCPPPGVAGAVECRRHICNGAESEGPACRPYRGRLR